MTRIDAIHKRACSTVQTQPKTSLGAVMHWVMAGTRQFRQTQNMVEASGIHF